MHVKRRDAGSNPAYSFLYTNTSLTIETPITYRQAYLSSYQLIITEKKTVYHNIFNLICMYNKTIRFSGIKLLTRKIKTFYLTTSTYDYVSTS